MGTNIIIKHIAVANSNGSATSSRVVTIHNAGDFEFKGQKEVKPIVLPTTKQNWPSITAITQNKIIDLERITRQASIKGYIVGDNARNTARTTLNGALNASVTTIPVTAAANLENASTYKPSYILIDDEMIKYTGKSGNNLTGCIRGFHGTTAATHTTLSNVYHPAFHFLKQLIYIMEAGGIAYMMYPANTSMEDTLGDSVSIDTSVVDLAKLEPQTGVDEVYGIAFSNYSFKEDPEDSFVAGKYNVMFDVFIGINQ